MRPSARAFLFAAALLPAGPAAVRADTVRLANGREMKGLITSETPDAVTLDFGYGSVTLQRADVVSIRRSGLAKRRALRLAKELEDLRDGGDAPEGGEALLAAYRRAAQARERLQDARARESDAADVAAGDDSRLARLVSDHRAVAERLASADRAADPEGYNRLVDEYNSGAAAIQARQMALAQRRLADADLVERGRDYLSAYQDFRRAFRRRPKPAAGASRDDRDFYDLMRDALAGMDGDFSREKVEAERQGPHWIVTALLDGRVRARLLVDTGASLVVISRAVADRLGPDAVVRGKGLASLADGRRVPTQILELPSVEVGRNRAERVLAGVMPDAPQAGVDGLLGMSFLSRFGLDTDPKSGAIYLRRLK
ncbi:MAG: clan AA aspartic protease [Elusimicrobia bacterium]|nr:clan AA aspartic protease [Elusimicrobiota bacterium]